MGTFKREIPVAELVSIIEEKRGNIANIARHYGMTRGTIYNRIKESALAQQALEDARESMLDQAENILYNKVLEGNTVELIFFLKTQGYKRGYGEKVENVGENGGPIKVLIEYADPDTDAA